MRARSTPAVLFHRTACAGFAFSFIALLAAPAWAQRGRSAPARRPASPPPMRTSMPRSQAPRMSPPMRQGPMREPAPPMRGPENTPRNGPYFGSPRPTSHARPTERMPRGGLAGPMNPARNLYPPMPRGKSGLRRGSPAPAPRYIPTTRTLMRRPVFTPMTSTALRGRIALLKALQNRASQSVYSLPGNTWSGYNAWTNYSLSPFFPSFTSVFGDPFMYFSFYSGDNCFGFSPLSDFTFDPYAAEYAYPLFMNPFCGAMFAPSLFSPAFFGPVGMPFGSDPLCPVCSLQTMNPFALGLDSGFLDAFSVSASALPSFSDGAFSGSIATPSGQFTDSPGAEGLVATSSTASLSSAAISETPFTMNHPALDHPLTLVFANGSQAKATRYWLASDMKLHYVTPSGSQMAIPLGQFDMSATMKANRKDGIRFLPQSPAQSKTGSVRR